ncbi:hypothetical protein ABDK56_09115 [Sphingomonas sp. ASV193]|uniref:hypothetical protein n=1 Tax=Sphingomonas sp. ASV193 TaxID=3144405 RepID=UPI0032E84F5D
MPRHDLPPPVEPSPVGPPPHSSAPIGPRLKRTAKALAAFSIAVAALAMALVAKDDSAPKLHLLIATGVGAALTIFLAGMLIALMIVSHSSGHDEAAAHPPSPEKD